MTNILDSQVKSKDIEQAYLDNIRTHQIGGQTDGISEAVAQDLGFESIGTTLEIVKKIGAVTCGECGEVVPCGTHTIRNERTGRIETVGY